MPLLSSAVSLSIMVRPLPNPSGWRGWHPGARAVLARACRSLARHPRRAPAPGRLRHHHPRHHRAQSLPVEELCQAFQARVAPDLRGQLGLQRQVVPDFALPGASSCGWSVVPFFNSPRPPYAKVSHVERGRSARIGALHVALDCGLRRNDGEAGQGAHKGRPYRGSGWARFIVPLRLGPH